MATPISRRRVSPFVLVAAVIAFVAVVAVTTREEGPKQALERATEALAAHDRAGFYEVVNVQMLEEQLRAELMPTNMSVLESMASKNDGASVVDVAFKALDAHVDQPVGDAVGTAILGAPVRVADVGRPETRGATSLVPVTFLLGDDSVKVRMHLQKRDGLWRLVGVRDLGASLAAARRETARRNGTLVMDSPRARGAAAAIMGELNQLAVLEEETYQANGRYTSDLQVFADVRTHNPGINVTVVTADSIGWAATATSPDLAEGVCGVWGGSTPSGGYGPAEHLPAELRSPVPGRPQCGRRQ